MMQGLKKSQETSPSQVLGNTAPTVLSSGESQFLVRIYILHLFQPKSIFKKILAPKNLVINLFT